MNGVVRTASYDVVSATLALEDGMIMLLFVQKFLCFCCILSGANCWAEQESGYLDVCLHVWCSDACLHAWCSGACLYAYGLAGEH